jgi:hypothetical protein
VIYIQISHHPPPPACSRNNIDEINLTILERPFLLWVQIKAIEILATFWTVLQLGNSIIVYEVSYNNVDGEDDNFIRQSLAVSTLTSLGYSVSIILRHINHLKWKKSKLYCLKDETIWSSGYWKLMVVEIIISLVAPQYFFDGLKVTEYNKDYEVDIEYEINTILC